jgi:hypothetical protein
MTRALSDDPRNLAFNDETWIKTNRAPLRGWGPNGERVRSFAPHGHWRNLTFLDALCCGPLMASFASSMAPSMSMANASVPNSNSGSSQSSGPEMPTSWTISEATSPPLCVSTSRPPAPGSGICRHTLPTSIRSSRHSPRSNTRCAPPSSDPSKTLGDTQGPLSQPSESAAGRKHNDKHSNI